MSYYPQLWREMHTKAAANNSRSYFCGWVRNLWTRLHCDKCQQHLQEYLSACPPESAPDLFVWSWELHNEVNVRLGKPVYPYHVAAIEHHVWR